MANLNKKPGVEMIIGVGKGPPPQKDTGSPDGADVIGEGEMAATRSIRRAIESNDDAALRTALKSFGAACGWGDSGDEEAPESEQTESM